MIRRSVIASAVLALAMLAEATLATAAPRVPSSAMPGREREQLFGRPGSQPPLIEWQDRRSRPVVTPSNERKRPAKRKRRTPRTR